MRIAVRTLVVWAPLRLLVMLLVAAGGVLGGSSPGQAVDSSMAFSPGGAGTLVLAVVVGGLVYVDVRRANELFVFANMGVGRVHVWAVPVTEVFVVEILLATL